VKFVESLHQNPVKIGNRPRFQIDRPSIAIAGIDAELVIDEIKGDFEHADVVRYR
jgi:hypothetical protein